MRKAGVRPPDQRLEAGRYPVLLDALPRGRVAAHRERRRAAKACPVPAEMLAMPRWVNHDERKRPVCPSTGRWASVTDPSTWDTWQAASARDSRIGFVLGGGIGCIDLDHCLDAHGRPSEAVVELLEFYAGSYVEISPSGDGLHVWGTAPERRGFRRTWKGQAVEFYSQDRYVTVTGRVFRPGALLPL